MQDNAYLHKGDTYHDPVANPFRQGAKTKKGGDGEEEKKEKPFMTAVSCLCFVLFPCLRINSISSSARRPQC